MLDALHEVPMEQRVAATRLMLNEGLSQLAPRLRGVVGCLAAKAKAGTGNREWGMEQVKCFRFIDSPKLQISTDDVSFPIPHSPFPLYSPRQCIQIHVATDRKSVVKGKSVSVG